jgi:hypothetical protein
VIKEINNPVFAPKYTFSKGSYNMIWEYLGLSMFRQKSLQQSQGFVPRDVTDSLLAGE